MMLLKKKRRFIMEQNVLVPKREEKRRYWEVRVREWEESGLRQAEYCRQNGLKIRNFGYWKRRLSETATDVSFASLQVQPNIFQTACPSAALLKVVLGRGQKIEVDEGFDPVTLKRLITTLDSL